MTQKGLRQPAHWMATASCRRPRLTGPSCALTSHGIYQQGFPSPFGMCRLESTVNHQTAIIGSTPDFSSRLPPEAFSTKGYCRQTPGDLNLRWAVKCHREIHVSFSPLAIRSSHVVFAYAKSLHPNVVPALLLDFSGQCLEPATCEFSCNSLALEAWKSEASVVAKIECCNKYINFSIILTALFLLQCYCVRIHSWMNLHQGWCQMWT